jgi:hypothetical protein
MRGRRTNQQRSDASEQAASELLALAQRLNAAAKPGDSSDVAGPLQLLKEAAIQVGEAWSGSAIGYHSRVYYADLAPPPPGAHFSSEWGFEDAYSNPTQGDWREYRYADLVAEIKRRAGDPDITSVRQASEHARSALETARGEARSILSAYLKSTPDELLQDLQEATDHVVAGTEQQFAHAALPSGQIMSRDMKALSDGVYTAPHFAVLAEVLALKVPFDACREMAGIAERAAAHIARIGGVALRSEKPQGEAVFIGHGRSPLWRELKDFIQDRAGLAWPGKSSIACLLPASPTSPASRRCSTPPPLPFSS